MAVCVRCELEMNQTNGCVKMSIKTVDGELDPILYGSETRDEPPPANHRCHDCGAFPGYYHHSWCDWEECPRCREHIFSCDCVLEDPEEEEAV